MMPDQAKLIQKTADYVRNKFSTESSGHDWWHMYRVWQLAKAIGEREQDADMFVVELAALLHDVADAKLTVEEGDGVREIRTWLSQNTLDEAVIGRVTNALRNISFSSSLPGSSAPRYPASLEAKIVSDADKLDAIGAVGIGRAFAYGGNKGRKLHDPDRAGRVHEDAEAYHTADTPTISHFHEKLLLLKDRMYTQTAKEMAQHRHEYMEQFLGEFFAEWDGKR